VRARWSTTFGLCRRLDEASDVHAESGSKVDDDAGDIIVSIDDVAALDALRGALFGVDEQCAARVVAVRAALSQRSAAARKRRAVDDNADEDDDDDDDEQCDSIVGELQRRYWHRMASVSASLIGGGDR
jgi:hypothetical protein